MGRKNKEVTEAVAEILEEQQRPYTIATAQIKDGFCSYSYNIIRGIGTGDTHTVKGSGIVKDDMRTAFNKLNVHLAFMDDIFKHAGIEVDDIDTLHNHELTLLYNVTGFKIKGDEDNESIVLMGTKYVSGGGGRIEMETPKVALDNLSSYVWYNELKAAAADARLEVALYKEGKYDSPEVEEEEEKKQKRKQTKITFDEGGADGTGEPALESAGGTEFPDDFAEAAR